jgi:retron-type reverse transcriptase
MQDTKTVLQILKSKGSKGLPVERLYRQLFNPEYYLFAYDKIYRNKWAMTKGSTPETVDGMRLDKIHRIIKLLKSDNYRWVPFRKAEIPKPSGKGMRTLGIPTWSDKLLQQVLLKLLGSYYEQRFSSSSHGHRPRRGCHTALETIKTVWTGTTWFIEGDIRKCFDKVNHQILLSIISRDIKDGRLIQLLKRFLCSNGNVGIPQGGIFTPPTILPKTGFWRR